MKKKIVLLSILLLLVSGCSIHQLSPTNFADNIEFILSQNTDLANVNFDGYEYYVPKGMRFVNKDEYNALLQDRFANQYYLYIDAISYFHHTKNTYKVDKDAYYSKRLNYNKKTGYIEINKVDNQYFVEFVFNYGKIEAYVSKEHLVYAINNMCYILQSIRYHDKVLESLIGNNVLNYKEETFNIFESKSDDNSSLKYEDYEEADMNRNNGAVDGDNFEINEVD